MDGYASIEAWVRSHVVPVAPIEIAHERPWSTVLRVPLADSTAWLKACAPVQAFEPRLSAQLYARWPDRVGGVLAHDEERAWVLFTDAGVPVGAIGNPPEVWLDALPLYAELQRGEVVHADDHVAYGVPPLPVLTLPARYAERLERELPLEHDEIDRLRAFASRFEQLCTELATDGLPATLQHDDLHMANVYEHDGRRRLLDWGDSSISHPFFSLIVTFRFLEERTRLRPSDPWFSRLRDAYLEPWGDDLADAFTLAFRVGSFAHPIAWARQREFLSPAERRSFDIGFAHVLRRALATISDTAGGAKPPRH